MVNSKSPPPSPLIRGGGSNYVNNNDTNITLNKYMTVATTSEIHPFPSVLKQPAGIFLQLLPNSTLTNTTLNKEVEKS